ncbi:hypothetical protein [Spiroplasma endosymbiont of Amphibalanus improvisus]|uniref:hypothetical protein n=1 Tax=Spiroplasma endosymbiont of Amphibalanus improvisus TaxID=3066327 RepID=UPI00313C1DBE
MLGYKFWGTKALEHYFLFYGRNGKLIAFFNTEKEFNCFLKKMNIMNYDIRWINNVALIDFDFRYAIKNCRNRKLDDIFFSETRIDEFKFNRSKNVMEIVKKLKFDKLK